MSYEGTQRWRKKAKTWIVRYMGGKCSVCGYNKYDGNLASHHIDEKTKEKTISSLINKCHSWKRILKEADKCVLVCHNCHGEIHIGMTECPDLDSERRKLVLEEIESEKPIPKSGKYHYCPECGEMVNDLQKYCSNDCKNKAQQRIKIITLQ